MRRVGLLVLAAADVLTLAMALPGPELPGRLAAPHEWIAAAGVDAVTAELAAAGLWLAAFWTAVGLASLAVSHLPGGVGRAADRLARVVLPRAIYRLAAGAAGAGVLLAPVAASAHHPATVAAPAWPTSSSLPAPAWPLGAALPAHRASPSRHPGHHPPPDSQATVVTVRPGDSLWTIAAAHLADGRPTPARIAAEWPRWFAANRAVIGADPDHLIPGEVLTAPHPGSRPAAEEASS